VMAQDLDPRPRRPPTLRRSHLRHRQPSRTKVRRHPAPVVAASARVASVLAVEADRAGAAAAAHKAAHKADRKAARKVDRRVDRKAVRKVDRRVDRKAVRKVDRKAAASARVRAVDRVDSAKAAREFPSCKARVRRARALAAASVEAWTIW
jgi:hypothetical protein